MTAEGMVWTHTCSSFIFSSAFSKSSIGLRLASVNIVIPSGDYREPPDPGENTQKLLNVASWQLLN
jgi:hypothetical protein